MDPAKHHILANFSKRNEIFPHCYSLRFQLSIFIKGVLKIDARRKRGRQINDCRSRKNCNLRIEGSCL